MINLKNRKEPQSIFINIKRKLTKPVKWDVQKRKGMKITENGEYEIVPDSPYNAMEKAVVNVDIPMEYKVEEFKENGEFKVYPSEDFDGMKSVEVKVDVPQPQIEGLNTVTYRENGSYTVLPSEGYAGIEAVDIEVDVPLKEEEVLNENIIQNGSYSLYPPEGSVWNEASILVDIPIEENRELDLDIYYDTKDMVITPSEDFFEGMKKVTGEVHLMTGDASATFKENGQYKLGDLTAESSIPSKDSVFTVDVPQPELEELASAEYTVNGSYNITPSEGFGGIKAVDIEVNVPSKEEEEKTVEYTENGIYEVTPSDGKAISKVGVTVNVPQTSDGLDLSGTFTTIYGGNIDMTKIPENIDRINIGNNTNTSSDNPSTALNITKFKKISASKLYWDFGYNYPFTGSTSLGNLLECMDFDGCTKIRGGRFYFDYTSASISYIFPKADLSKCERFGDWIVNTHTPSPKLSLNFSLWENFGKASSSIYTANAFRYFGGALVDLDISSWDMSNFSEVGQTFFYNCKNLEYINFGYNCKKDITIGGSTYYYSSKLSRSSIISVLMGLYDFSTEGGTHTCTLGSTYLSMLDDNEKAIAINKGWTLA